MLSSETEKRMWTDICRHTQSRFLFCGCFFGLSLFAVLSLKRKTTPPPPS